MQTDYERYIKMSSLAQIGWWEADFAAGHYLCSDFLCDLLGLEGDTISFRDFQEASYSRVPCKREYSPELL